MSDPVLHNGYWWAQQADGSWLRWDQASQVWVPAQGADATSPYGYPAPAQFAPAYPYYPARTTNGWAVASLVVGLCWLWWVGSVLAVVFGFVGLHEIKQSQGTEEGKGLAIAGIAIGAVPIGFLLIGMGASLIDLPS